MRTQSCEVQCDWEGAWSPGSNLGVQIEASPGRSSGWTLLRGCQSSRARLPWEGPSSTRLAGALLPRMVGIHAGHVAVQALGVPALGKAADPVSFLAGRDLEWLSELWQLSWIWIGCCLARYRSVEELILDPYLDVEENGTRPDLEQIGLEVEQVKGSWAT